MGSKNGVLWLLMLWKWEVFPLLRWLVSPGLAHKLDFFMFFFSWYRGMCLFLWICLFLSSLGVQISNVFHWFRTFFQIIKRREKRLILLQHTRSIWILNQIISFCLEFEFALLASVWKHVYNVLGALSLSFLVKIRGAN